MERRIAFDNKGSSVVAGDQVAAASGKGLRATVEFDDDGRVRVVYPAGGTFGPMTPEAFAAERWTKVEK